jgi:hypothetical protein
MRRFPVILIAMICAGGAAAQQQPGSNLAPGLNGSLSTGLQSGLGGGLSSGLEAGLGLRNLGPRSGDLTGGGAGFVESGGCAPGQADPDHRGCRSTEWVRQDYTRGNYTADPNRITTYYGNDAMESR